VLAFLTLQLALGTLILTIHQTRLVVMRALVVLFYSLPLLAESAAGLHWTAPPEWKNEGSRPMRAATYIVDDAECVVYFFGPGQGGTVEANIDRWKGQFKPSDAKVNHRTVHGLPVTTIDASGEYSGMGGPMAAAPTTKSGYRLLGAIVEGPGGNLFIKFTGPIKTVAANQQKFERFLGTFDKN
jgi:hypothetical protein